jgi:signal transduction histidine kinase
VASTDELNGFIGSILELTKIDSDKVVVNLQQKDINDLVESVIDRYRTQARRRHIEIRKELEPMFPIKLDPSLISKVVANLIDNAMKYSPDGSKILITTEEENDSVVISVSDQGIGLSEDDQKKLFTRFFRAKNDTTTKIAGTGLGLYLTRYFVEAHSGVVEVESELGQGSTFRIKLPVDAEKLSSQKPGLTLSKVTDWFSSQKRNEGAGNV